jgi:CRISPR-associated endonuclease/helicase Cas3
VLLRSWLALKDRASMVIPAEVEELIEAVYDERECPAGLSAAIRNQWAETRKYRETELEYEREEAKRRWLKHPSYRGQLWRLTSDPRDEDAPDFHQAHQALTRLAEPSVALVLMSKLEATDLNRKNAREVLMRSVSVADKRVLGDLIALAVPTEWARSALLRHHRLIVLEDDNTKRLGRHSMRYDAELGVVVSNDSAHSISA